MLIVGHFEFDRLKNFKVHPPPETHILFYSNGLAFWHGLPDIRPIEVNNADCRPC